MRETMWHRLALLAVLVEQAPQPRLGRTMLMKLLFLLATVRGVGLSYRFRLYSYGLFDSGVASDIHYAARLDALSIEMERYPNGYGYYIQAGPAARYVMDRARAFLDEHQQDIDWVINTFAPIPAADLDLLSTIVYVDRMYGLSSLDEIVTTVDNITQHAARPLIQQKTQWLQDNSVLYTA